MPDIRLFKTDGITVSYDIDSQLLPMCEGMISLAQVVINGLLTDPGTDMFNPARGGGLGSLIRRIRIGGGALDDAVGVAVRKVEAEILEDQKVVPLPDNERLLSLSLVSVKPVPDHPDHCTISVSMRVATGATVSFAF